MSRRFLGRMFAVTMAVALLSPARAEEELPVAPDELVFCTVCHGVQLMGNKALKAPRLSGMDAWYVENQLHAFKRGWRATHPDDLVGMEMRPMAAGLSDRQIEKAAGFVSRTSSPLPPQTIDGDATAGQQLYASCAACHGADGAGNEALGAPALTAQNDWYMVHQLENYRAGIRGYDAEDTYGQQMRASVALLGDDVAIRNVVKYITTLETN